MINKNIWLYLLIVFGLSSCTTYYIPIYSFKEQVKDIDSTELRTVYTRGPMGNIVEYKTYPIDYIKCVDKNNNPTELKNGPSIEIRFTEKITKGQFFILTRSILKTQWLLEIVLDLYNIKKQFL